MTGQNVTALIPALPADATNADALSWIERLRRVLMRREELPSDQTPAMTPELAQKALDELCEMERLVRRDMAASHMA
jgi:hypothetical protein